MTIAIRCAAVCVLALAIARLSAEEFALRVRVLTVDGKTPASRVAFTVGPRGAPGSTFAGRDWSPWIDGRADAGSAASVWRVSLKPTPEQVRAEERAKSRELERERERARDRARGSTPPPARAPAAAPVPRLGVQVEMRLPSGETSASEADLFGPLLAVELWKDAGGAVRIDTRAGRIRREFGPLFEAARIPED